MNPCIVTFFMDNIDMKTVGLQRSVIEKFNPSKVQLYQIKVDVPHAVAIDYFWAINGCSMKTFEHVEIQQEFDHDVVIFLDIDCIPLNEKSIDYMVEQALAGKLIGNVQRTNHIQNNKHVFAAPSASAISKETFIKLGCPSAIETKRSDVAEEWTWLAEEMNIDVELLSALKYEAPPIKMDWESNQDPWWELGEGMKPFGIGTTYGNDKYGDMFYHNFQIRHDGQKERFWNKCESILVS